MKLAIPNTRSQQRILIVDVARGAGILLVVLGHNWIVGRSDGSLRQCIYSFHVLLFFFLSGIFINPDEPFSDLLKKRFQGLIKPFLVVSVLLALTHVVTAAMKHHVQNFNLLRYSCGAAYATGAVIEWTPMWFLTSAFVSLLVTHRFLALLRGRSYWLGYTVALSLVALGALVVGKFWLGPYDLGFSVTSPAAGLPWSVDLLPITVGFMLLGRLLAPRMRTFTFSVWGLGASVVIFFGLHFVSDNVMDLNKRIYGEPLTSTLKALAGIYLCVSICALLARVEIAAKALSNLGQATLFVLIFHYPIQMAVFGRLNEALGQPWLAAVASFAVSVLVSFALWELTVRYAGLRRLIR